MLKQSLEDQLAQLNKALEKAKADVTAFTMLPVAGQPICEGFLGGFSGGVEGVSRCNGDGSAEEQDTCTDGRSCFGRHRGSHTARSGQVPHTPGGTKVLSDPTTVGPTLRGAARSRTLQEGLR